MPASPISADDADAPRPWGGSEIGALWLMPFTIGITLLESLASVSDAWCQMLFSPAHHHAHETHQDLEVPDPIEDDGEHDLFA